LEHAHANLTTLSIEWKTREFLHIAIAIALLPNAKQKALMNNLFELGKTQMLSITSRLTK
jgi:hypothetical protein